MVWTHVSPQNPMGCTTSVEEAGRYHCKAAFDSLQRLWRLAEVPADGKKEKFISIFRKDKEEDPGNDRLVSLTLVSGKVVKDTELAITSKKNE